MNDLDTLAQEMLKIIPAAMRTVSADIRRSGNLLSPAHFGVLVTLALHPCNLSSLAEEQGVSLPTMSSTVSTLEERGWVKRTRSTKDRRVVNVELTEAGLKRLLEIQGYAERKLRAILDPITDEERETLSAGLMVMRRLFEISENQNVGDDCID